MWNIEEQRWHAQVARSLRNLSEACNKQVVTLEKLVELISKAVEKDD